MLQWHPTKWRLNPSQLPLRCFPAGQEGGEPEDVLRSLTSQLHNVHCLVLELDDRLSSHPLHGAQSCMLWQLLRVPAMRCT